MGFLFVFGIIAGIVMLLFPDLYRGLHRLGNEMDGVETKHGTAFEVNRMIGGVVLILLGIFGLTVL